EERDVVTREQQLCAPWVEVGVQKQTDYVSREIRVQARVEFIDQQHAALPQRIQSMPGSGEPRDRPGALPMEGELEDVPVVPVVAERDDVSEGRHTVLLDLLPVIQRLQHPEQPLPVLFRDLLGAHLDGVDSEI